MAVTLKVLPANGVHLDVIAVPVEHTVSLKRARKKGKSIGHKNLYSV